MKPIKEIQEAKDRLLTMVEYMGTIGAIHRPSKIFKYHIEMKDQDDLYTIQELIDNYKELEQSNKNKDSAYRNLFKIFSLNESYTDKIFREKLLLEQALNKLAELLEGIEKDNCVYCPFDKYSQCYEKYKNDNCVDEKQKHWGHCRKEKWKEWSLKCEPLSAKEMFEELGLIQVRNDSQWIKYVNGSVLHYAEVDFGLDLHTTATYGDDIDAIGEFRSKVHIAIDKQREELGWDNETN